VYWRYVVRGGNRVMVRDPDQPTRNRSRRSQKSSACSLSPRSEGAGGCARDLLHGGDDALGLLDEARPDFHGTDRLAWVFQTITDETGRRGVSGQAPSQIAVALRPIVAELIDSLDHWLGATVDGSRDT